MWRSNWNINNRRNMHTNSYTRVRHNWYKTTYHFCFRFFLYEYSSKSIHIRTRSACNYKLKGIIANISLKGQYLIHIYIWFIAWSRLRSSGHGNCETNISSLTPNTKRFTCILIKTFLYKYILTQKISTNISQYFQIKTTDSQVDNLALYGGLFKTSQYTTSFQSFSIAIDGHEKNFVWVSFSIAIDDHEKNFVWVSTVK